MKQCINCGKNAKLLFAVKHKGEIFKNGEKVDHLTMIACTLACMKEWEPNAEISKIGKID